MKRHHMFKLYSVYQKKKKKKKTHSLFVTKNAVMDEIINSNLSIISLCN